jgi:3-oxoacyl-[acyl-carrier protein] reductase
VGIDNGEQGVPLCDLSADDYCRPITDYTRTHFVTAKAAAHHMANQGSGVILPLSIPMAGMPEALSGPFGQAAAAIENLALQLAAELGPQGIRVVCLRPTGMPETARSLGSHLEGMWTRTADRMGVSFEELLGEIGSGTARQRPLDVQELADMAAVMASDHARGVTGTVANVTAGAILH